MTLEPQIIRDQKRSPNGYSEWTANGPKKLVWDVEDSGSLGTVELNVVDIARWNLVNSEILQLCNGVRSGLSFGVELCREQDVEDSAGNVSLCSE